MEIYKFNDAPGKPVVNLAYANGFLPQTYELALQPLFNDYQVISTHMCAMWGDYPPESLKHWAQLGDDLLMMLNEHGLADHPIINVGHSVGGVATLYAAIKRPEQFSRVVLIDPTFLAPNTLRLLRVVRFFRKEYGGAMAEGALRRRRQWESTEAAFQSFRKKPLFRRWPEQNVRAYAECMTTPAADGGVELAYPPEWEAQIYKTVPTNVWSLPKKLKVPAMVIYGEHTDVFTDKNAAYFHRLNPRVRMEMVQGAGHLVPQEKPEQVGKLIVDFLNNKN